MAVSKTLAVGVSVAPPRVSEWKHFRKAFFSRKLVIIGLVIIGLLILTAIFADLITPYDPYKVNMSSTLQGPSMKHWLGTDTLGRDTLSRIIFGTRTALTIGLIATLIS